MTDETLSPAETNRGVQIDDPQLLAEFSKFDLSLIPQCKALGFEFTRIARARTWGKIAWREDLVGDAQTGVIAGGAITTMLDTVCGGAVQAALGSRKPIVTLDLRIDYMRPAEPKREIHCEAHCYKVTRSVCFVRASAYHDSADDPIAAAAAAFMLVGAERESAKPDASGAPMEQA